MGFELAQSSKFRARCSSFELQNWGKSKRKKKERKKTLIGPKRARARAKVLISKALFGDEK
ncbi:conserved hypothetical protein [Ricinus communis]|uniref:Uncharacterized protein n=1 Tax=Ricinus communis TaxID=3988 RepID=B9RV97_RICCO|nr:conserved hypothetical protein [Ricinus communis]